VILAAYSSTFASNASTWRSRLSIRASVELTHTVDHAKIPKSIALAQ